MGSDTTGAKPNVWGGVHISGDICMQVHGDAFQTEQSVHIIVDGAFQECPVFVHTYVYSSGQ